MVGAPDPSSRHVVADLVYDTRTQPLTPGVRATVQRARRLLYTAAETELVLQMVPVSRLGHLRIVGQVLDDAGPVESARVRLRRASEGHEESTDEDGEFRFSDVQPGRYELDVETSGWRVSVADLDVS